MGSEYTTLAHRYTAKFPFLTYLGTQINFWIVANLLLMVLLNMQSHIYSLVFGIDAIESTRSQFIISVLFGIIYGLVYGFIGYFFERIYRKLPLGVVILFKAAVSLTLLFVMLILIRFILLDQALISLQLAAQDTLSDEVWKYIFYLLLIYYFFMSVLISYINQVNKKYGPGILIPLLLGRYRYPREEERIFMFMDLKSSTATAEKLGHLKYSSFLRDCFEDINELLLPYRAQVYQYVGDEIVVMWPELEGLKDLYCFRFFFACKKRFQDRKAYYLDRYGLIPDFKTGLHSGKVTAVEIGEIKKDIAYHGDTLNTTARIQSVCNQYNKDFLVSEFLLDKVRLNGQLRSESLGQVLLKGKTNEIGIASVEGVDETNA